jgi:hypothetical protein
MLVSRSELLLAVALQRTEGHLGACFLPHRWQQLGVVDGAMRAVGGKDGRTHVSADLCFAQHARSATALTLLQRARCAIPAAVPILQCAPSSLDGVTERECSEAVSARAWSVLEEDCVLGLCAEVRHAAVLCELGGGGSAELRSAGARQKRVSTL